MRAFLVFSFVFVVAAALAGSMRASEVTTVRGEVVDLACSVSRGASGTGESHAVCAMTCARNGNPMAVLTADAVYVIEGSYTADKNAKLLDFVARKVEAKGTITERDGTIYINVAAMTVQKDE